MLHPWGFTSALPDNEPELVSVFNYIKLMKHSFIQIGFLNVIFTCARIFAGNAYKNWARPLLAHHGSYFYGNFFFIYMKKKNYSQRGLAVAAEKALSSVRGTRYTIGSSTNVLCE